MDQTNSVEISVAELDQKIDHCFALKETYAEASKLKTQADKELKKAQEEIINILQALGKTSYKSSKGNFGYNIRETFKVPETTKDREEFFNFLKKKEIFNKMIMVHASKLNSWAKEEIAANPDVLDYQIPGLVKCPPQFVATMRKS